MSATTYEDGYAGRALVDDHTADVDLSSVRQIVVDEHGSRALGDMEWSGRAMLYNPPSFDLLDFTGAVTVRIGGRRGYALVVDATPGSGYLYLRGIGTPPFGVCPVP